MSDDSVTQISNQTQVQKLLGACRDSASYPQNILQTHKSIHVLEKYYEALGENQIFSERRRMTVLDYYNGDGARLAHLEVLVEEVVIGNDSVDELQRRMNAESPDPDSRYIFIPTTNSRGPMCCSKEQLTYMMSFLQVMPSALDIFLELRIRDHPLSNTLFRRENFFGKQNQSLAIPQLKRSGFRLQHAFNVLGFEFENHKNEYSWPLRNVSVYHAFDIGTGNAVWIVSKANRLIQQRIKNMTDRYQKYYPDEAKSPEGALAVSLRVHALILEYSTENLGRYITHLENQAAKHSAKVKMAPVARIVKEIPENQTVAEDMDFRLRSQHNTGLSHVSAHTSRTPSFPLLVSGITRIRRTFSGKEKEIAKPDPPQTADPTRNRTLIEDTFSFDDLQSLHRLAGEVEKAIMVFGQNKRILSDVKGTYQSLLDSVDFGTRINISLCEHHILDFIDQARNIELDLENYSSRVQTLLHGLEKDESMFNTILQYKSMATGEFFASAARKSALTMQRLTEDMHQVAVDTKRETVSMHAITILTLVFLPGTFVAVRDSGIPSVREFEDPVLTRGQTFFSSNIIAFDNGDGTDRLGDWTINKPALKLFIAMCIPLMAVTLLSWFSWYLLARRQRRINNVSSPAPISTDDQKGVSGEV